MTAQIDDRLEPKTMGQRNSCPQIRHDRGLAESFDLVQI
jgi:hypothetical protein